MTSSSAAPRGTWLLFGSALLADLVLIVLWSRGVSAAVYTGFFLAGIGVICGYVLVRASRWDQHRSFRFNLGVGILIIGLGSAVSAAATLWWASPAPNIGDFLQMLSLPWIALGLAAIPRGLAEPIAGLRFMLEGFMLGAFLTLLWWRVLIHTSDGWMPDGTRVGINAVTLVIVSLIFIVMLQSPDRGLLIGGLGGVLIAGADAITTLLITTGGDQVVLAVALATAYPVMTIGLTMLSARPPELSERLAAVAEARRYVVVSTVFFGLVVASCWLIYLDQRIDQVTAFLFFVGLTALWARELTRAAQQNVMLNQMRFLAHRDPLTRLGNRRALEDELRESRSARGHLTLLTIDLDGFKSVNDQLGHAAGDQLLVRVARLVDFEARSIQARAFRVGGDEFVVVSTAGEQASEEAAQRIVEGTELAGVAGGSHALVSVGASVGIVHRQLTGYTALTELLTDLGSAGTAMRQAKREGAGRLVVFDDRLATRSQRRFDVEKKLTAAVVDGSITVRFQPMVSLRTGLVAGVEALARWTDPDLGAVGPSEFVPVAEESGLIRELGDQIMRSALRGAVSSGLIGRGLSLSVNVSTIQLRAPGFAEIVAQVLADLQVPARQLVIEVTESVFVRTDDPAIRTLSELADLGVRLALDDFGTGYSSIGYLTRLPVCSLKLDRTMTMRLGESSVWAIARSVVEMASALGLDVVIEGVENAQIERDARRLGADQAQGWFYADALTARQLAALLQDRAAQRMS